MDEERRIGAGCLAHARRKFDELLLRPNEVISHRLTSFIGKPVDKFKLHRAGSIIKDNLNTVGTQAIQRIAALYKIEREIKGFSVDERHTARQSSSKVLCNDLHEWLKLERLRVPEGNATAKAIAYSLNR